MDEFFLHFSTSAISVSGLIDSNIIPPDSIIMLSCIIDAGGTVIIVTSSRSWVSYLEEGVRPPEPSCIKGSTANSEEIEFDHTLLEALQPHPSPNLHLLFVEMQAKFLVLSLFAGFLGSAQAVDLRICKDSHLQGDCYKKSNLGKGVCCQYRSPSPLQWLSYFHMFLAQWLYDFPRYTYSPLLNREFSWRLQWQSQLGQGHRWLHFFWVSFMHFWSLTWKEVTLSTFPYIQTG